MVAPSKVARTQVILGIDWGSTAIRLALYYLLGKPVERVWNTQAICTQDGSRYEKGAWNASINISGNGPLYTGDEVYLSSLQIPSKLVLGNGKGVDADNPLFAEIRRNQDNPRFESRCLEAVKEIIKSFSAELQTLCENAHQPLEIVDIGLTTPAHWTLAEQERYTRLLKEAFPLSARWNGRLRNIDFHTEIEAVAHFICHEPRHADEIIGSSGNKFVLFLDFGGHSLNGCIFFVRKTDQKYVFCRVQDPFGERNFACVFSRPYRLPLLPSETTVQLTIQSVVGGTAQWEASVSQFCTENTMAGDELVESEELQARVRNSLLKKFREEVMLLQCGAWEEMVLRVKAGKDYGHSSGSRDFYTCISGATSWCFFKDALEKPLQMARENILELARLQRSQEGAEAQVVVSGGSGKNKSVQEYLRKYCADADIPEPKFVYENVGSDDSFNIAKGAAIATANNMTFRQFLDNGAAFGIQMMQGDNNPGRVWDSKGLVIFSGSDRQRENLPVFCSSGRDRFKIICDPFWVQKPRNKTVDVAKCYDVLDLLMPTKGLWQFQLSLRNNGDHSSLLLERRQVTPGGQEIRALEPVNLHMRLDRSPSCFLIQPDKAIDSLHCGLGLTASGEFIAVTAAVETEMESVRRSWPAVNTTSQQPSKTAGTKSSTRGYRQSKGKGVSKPMPPPRAGYTSPPTLIRDARFPWTPPSSSRRSTRGPRLP